MAARAAPDTDTSLSDASPHADAPPRLVVCINEHELSPDRTSAGDGSWSIPGAGQAEPHHVAGVLKAVCRWLDDDAAWGRVWDTPAGEHPNPDVVASPGGRDEERWARLVEQLFYGGAYGGPDIFAALPEKSSVRGFTRMMKRFCRFQSGAPVIDDPAVSLWVACQHLTTYGAMSRGIDFDADLGNNGIPASQAAYALPIFRGAWYSPGEIITDGKTEPLVPITADQAHHATTAAGIAKDYGPGSIYTYNPAGLLSFIYTRVPKDELMHQSNGELYRDADGHPVVAPKFAQQKLLEAQQNDKLATDKINQAAAMLAKLGVKVPKIERDPMGAARASHETAPPTGFEPVVNIAGVHGAKLKIHVQLDGSHVAMVLRRYRLANGQVAVQLLDTSPHPRGDARNAPGEQLGVDYALIANATQSGIYGGEGHASVARKSQGGFVGMGTLPPLRHASTMFDLLERTRPVGLARLVVARRKSGPSLMLDDVLYVSKMIPIWSPKQANRNYTLSRLAWSLRNTPWRRQLQAYWIVYSPAGALADVMWEAGARTLSMAEMERLALERGKLCFPATQDDINAYQSRHAQWARSVELGLPGVAPPPEPQHPTTAKWSKLRTGRDLRTVAVLSHDEEGKALHLWRAHSLRPAGDGSVPKVIEAAFVKVSGITAQMLKNKQEELKRVMEAEAARRLERATTIQKTIERLHPKAARGDAEAKAEIDRLLAERAAIWKAPFPELNALFEFGASWADESHYHPVLVARSDPMAAYVAPECRYHLTSASLPEILR